MRPDSDYAPCPECAADNVIYRSACWRCGALLPYSLGLDGHMHRNTSARSPRERTQIEILLDTSRRLAVEQDHETSLPEETRTEPPSGL